MKDFFFSELLPLIFSLIVSSPCSDANAALLHNPRRAGASAGLFFGNRGTLSNKSPFKMLLPSLIIASGRDAHFAKRRLMELNRHETSCGLAKRVPELVSRRPYEDNDIRSSSSIYNCRFQSQAPQLMPLRCRSEDGFLNKDIVFSAPNVLHPRTGRSFYEKSQNDEFISDSCAPAVTMAVSPDDEERLAQWHGTTTLSLRVQGGIVIAVDSRASIGSFVGSHTTKKVIPITSHIVATMAGGAADCQHILREVSGQIRVMESVMNDRIAHSSRGSDVEVRSCRKLVNVGLVARILAHKLRSLRSEGVSVGTMLSGYDLNGPSLFYIDDQGNCIKGNCFSVGSGSLIANSILQSEYCNPEIPEKHLNSSQVYPTVENGISLALRAVRHAINRDCYSGGYINVFLVNATGSHHVVRKHHLEIDL